MVGKIEEYYAKYDAAASDPELLETFWAEWGNTKRKACINMRAYDQYQECGYTEEPRFNEYGWLANDVEKSKAERVVLFGDGYTQSYVECLQLPNGKWIGGKHYMLAISGASMGLSVWCKQYDTRIECLTEQMRDVANAIKASEKMSDKQHLAPVVKAMNDIRQLSLF